MLIDCNGNEIKLNERLVKHGFIDNEDTYYIFKNNEYGKPFLYETDKDGNILDKNFAHMPADEAVKLVNNDEIKWYRIDL